MRGFVISGTVCFFLFLLFPYLPISLVFITLLVGVIGLILFSFLKKPKQKERVFACFFVVAASLIYILNHYSVALPSENLSGEAEVIGTIINGPEEDGGIYKYEIKIKTVNGEKFKGSALVFTENGLKGEGGDIISLSGEVCSIENDGFFNSKAYYYSNGIFLKVSAEDKGRIIGSVPSRKFFRNASLKVSSSLKETVGGEAGALLAGIVANDKNSLSDGATDIIRKAGYSHLINVSGLHLSIVSSFFFLILTEFLRIKRKLASLINCVLVFLYMAITAFSVSSIRAGIMLIIYFVGIMIERDSDSKNSLGAAVTFILILNPFAATNASFLLSTLSTAGIIIATDFILRLRKERKITSALTKILMFLSPAFSAVVFSAPAAIIIFGEINLISPISNLVISFLITPVVILGLVLAVLVLITGANVITGIIGLIAGVFCKIILFSASVFSEIPLIIDTKGISAKILIFAVVLLIMVLISKLKRKRIVIIFCAVTVLISCVGSAFERKQPLKDSVYFISADDYKSYVYIADGKVAVFGVEGYKSAKAVSGLLDSLGINSVEYFYLRNASPQSMDSADYIIDNFSVERVIITKESKDYKVFEDKLLLYSSYVFEDFSFLSKTVVLVEKNETMLVMNFGDKTKDFPFAVEITTPDGETTRISSEPLAEAGEKDYNKSYKTRFYRLTFDESAEFKEVKTLVSYYR